MPPILAICHNWLLINNDMQTTLKLKTWIKIVRHNMSGLSSGFLDTCSIQPIPTQFLYISLYVSCKPGQFETIFFMPIRCSFAVAVAAGGLRTARIFQIDFSYMYNKD